MKNRLRILCLGALTLLGVCAAAPAAAQHSADRDAVRVLPLDGEWRLTGYSPDRSRWVELVARVPGQVHDDLLREGFIDDPFWRDNAERCQWVEHWEWRYKRSFYLPEGFDSGRVQLCFDGLDTYAEITLNGRRIGPLERPTTENMFLEYGFDVSGWLKRGGENVLEVRFLPLERVVGEEARRKSYPAAFGDPLRAYVRRMQCTFGWDWVHRFVTAGIWRSCRLVAWPEARVEHPFVWVKELRPGKAVLHAEAAVEADDGFRGEVRMALTAPDGRRVWQAARPVTGRGTVSFEAEVPDPELWWPRGAGAQPLYGFEAAVCDAGGRLLHAERCRTGIRTVAVEESPLADGTSFILKVNGRRIFARGGNWVPADPFPARIAPERYRLLLGRAAEAGMNMVRVWGGGIYEQEPFWQACDSLGILVWQDFMLACGGYPEERPEFVDLFLREVACNVRRMRNHPSLAVWCGDNELGMNHAPDGEWPFSRVHRECTAPLVAQLDPSRPFRPTSPYGAAGDPSKAGDAHQGAQYADSLIFSDDASAYRVLTGRYARARFLSESTTAGVPTRRSLLRFMDGEDLSRSEMFDYHTKDNPYVGGGLTLFGKLESLSEKLYGEHGGDVGRRLRQMEYTQYEFVRLTMEAARANKFRTGGVLFWMYNDCWPASGWSLIDYWGEPKAGWYAMKSACRSVIASTEQGDDGLLRWRIASDAAEPADVTYEVRVQPLDGGRPRVLSEGRVRVAPDAPQQVLELPAEPLARELGDGRIVVFEVHCGPERDRSFWTPLTPRQVAWPATKLEVSLHRPAAEGEVRIASSRWGRVVTLEGAALFEDNYFEMLPGETRTVRWRSFDGTPVPEIRVTAWNAR